jgi:transcriptional regulator
MYIPHAYKNKNPEEVREFIRENAFGILVNLVDGRPWATHIPLELEQDVRGNYQLVGHISRANKQAETLENPQQVLCIFNGPHAYVSSSWYREEEVPTWDYIAVHVYGQLNLQTESELSDALGKLVERYEQKSENPVSLSTMSEHTLRQIKGVVGFRISIEEVHAAYKLSQGRPDDHESIIGKLESRDDPGSREIARAIRAGKKRTK